MKISCDIIRDLLPLYKDKLASEESRLMIREHLKDCESCRKYLKTPDIGFASPARTDTDTDIEKKYKALCTKIKRRRSILWGSVAALLVLSFGYSIYSIINDNK